MSILPSTGQLQSYTGLMIHLQVIFYNHLLICHFKIDIFLKKKSTINQNKDSFLSYYTPNNNIY